MSSKRSDIAPTVDEEREAMFAELGRALSTWTRIEAALLAIFHLALVRADLGPTSAAFYAVINFRTKLDMADAALSIRLHGQPVVLEQWASLSDRILSAIKQRVPLAHHSIMTALTARAGQRCLLAPSIRDANTWPIGSKKRTYLSLNDIKGRTETFNELVKELMRFRDVLAALPEPQEGCYELRIEDVFPRNALPRNLRRRRDPPESSRE